MVPLAEVIKQLKGSSSHFINQNNLTVDKFSWQTSYAAYSISVSVIEKVFNYIKNQKEHHHKMTFTEELKQILIENGIEWDERYLV